MQLGQLLTGKEMGFCFSFCFPLSSVSWLLLCES